jgi:hypothetical protein
MPPNAPAAQHAANLPRQDFRAIQLRRILLLLRRKGSAAYRVSVCRPEPTSCQVVRANGELFENLYAQLVDILKNFVQTEFDLLLFQSEVGNRLSLMENLIALAQRQVRSASTRRTRRRPIAHARCCLFDRRDHALSTHLFICTGL